MSDPLPHLTPVLVLVDAETTWTGRVVGWVMMPPVPGSDADVEAVARNLCRQATDPEGDRNPLMLRLHVDAYWGNHGDAARAALTILRKRHPGGLHYIVEIDGWPCEGHPYGCHTVAAERVTVA